MDRGTDCPDEENKEDEIFLPFRPVEWIVGESDGCGARMVFPSVVCLRCSVDSAWIVLSKSWIVPGTTNCAGSRTPRPISLG